MVDPAVLLQRSASGEGSGFIVVAVVAGGLFLILAIFVGLWAARYVKVGPNTALIVSGRRTRIGKAYFGFRIVTGGATLVIPVLEKAHSLSLELRTVDLKPPPTPSADKVAVNLDAVAQVKVDEAPEAIAKAAQQFLSKSGEEIVAILGPVLVGKTQQVIRKLNANDLSENQERLVDQILAAAAPDMEEMGMKIVSLAVKTLRLNKVDWEQESN